MFSRIMSWFENRVVPTMTRIGQLRYLLVLRDAFMLTFPVTIFGSFAVVLMNLPFVPEGFKDAMTSVFGNVGNATTNVVALFLAFGIGYYLSKSKGYDDDAHYIGITSIAGFLLVTPALKMLEDGTSVSGVFNITQLGAQGMFVCMLVSFFAAEMYLYVLKKGWKITMPSMVPPTVAKSFSALIPVIFSLLLVTLVNFGITTIFGSDIHSLIVTWVQAPLTNVGSTLGAALLITGLMQFLWFFGIHGDNVVGSVSKPIMEILRLENLEAYQAGEAIPHIVNQQFLDTFRTGFGGAGGTLIVVFIMIFFMKSKHLKDLGKLAIGPGVFNVNEPVQFGLPMVLNPICFVPMIVGPLLATLVAYYAMALGIVPLCTGVQIPWTTPFFIGGMMATNSVMGGVLQLVQMLVIAIVWFPFLKIIDRQSLEEITEEIAQ